MAELSADFVMQAPLIDDDRLQLLLKEHFGIKYAKTEQLTGYDDLNFLLNDVEFDDPSYEKKFGRKFVCKFSNPFEARNPELMDSQIKLMAHLSANGIPAPRAVPSRRNTNFVLAKMTENVTLPLRVFTFLPGSMMEQFGYSSATYKVVGNLLARFHALTDDYEDPWMRENTVPISVESWTYLQSEFHTLVDLNQIGIENQELCLRVFQDFGSRILEQRSRFEEGLVHSDFNETNILLEQHGEEIKVTGLLDFGDCHYSIRLMDVASAILYLILDAPNNSEATTEWRKIASEVLSAYKEIRPFEVDASVLQLAACGRLVASLIYGLRTVRINARGDDPSYTLKTQKRGWEMLKILNDPMFELF
ncbi:KA1 domain-containing protein [Aphelenchoides besseyi]|nr:KA1 domain-containing protein [Aphelenchoides besseyi]KAI6193859.1 KA1 domain-containing protein [Aphelenchoides besseyi]